MADMMWAGRFSKKVDETVNAFNSSIAFDGRMYKQDIQGSIAHAAMLGDCGIISKEDSLAIIGGLKEILADIENGTLEFDMTAEDIHMFIEAELTKRLGDVISFLRTLVFQVSAVFILPLLIGVNGIWLAVVAAEILTLIFSVIFLITNRKKYHY